MTWYTFFKSIHVIAAVVWVGGAAMIQLFALRIIGTRDGERQAEFAKDVETIGMRTFVPASVVLFLSAIGMMVNLHWSWSQNWIVFGLIVWGLSFAVGAGFLGPESGRIAKVIERDGPSSPEAGARIRRILMVSRVELVLLLGVIWNMVVKPVGQNGWFWGALIVIVAAAAAVLAGYVRSERSAAVPVAE
jgi:uncharacterized membrane protein